MYRIAVAAQSAGISTQLLRAWERRYGLLSPRRTEAGYRLYSDEDVAVLRGAKALVDQGQSISEVARLPREQIAKTVGRSPVVSAGASPALAGSFLDAAIDAIDAFDGALLEGLILRATGMGVLSSTEACDAVLMPLLKEIGDRWEKGEVDVAAEHFGTAIIRRHLHTLLQNEARRNAGAPSIVCACPEGDQHEGGLLGFALHAAARGWGIVYLGPNTPVRDLLAAADSDRAIAIALSITAPSTRASRRTLIDKLAAWRNKQPGRKVWLGGRGALAHQGEFEGAGLEVVGQAREFQASPGE